MNARRGAVLRVGTAVLAIAALGMGPLRSAQSAAPAALVMQLKGKAEVLRANVEAPEPAAVGMRLLTGDRLLLSPGATAVLLHSTGKMERVGTTVTITERRGGDAPGLFARTTTTLAQAGTKAQHEPNLRGDIRPLPGEAMAIAPRNRITVLDARPTFVWSPAENATSYSVQLRRVGGEVVRFEAGGDTTWTLPADQPPLVPGADYEWTILAGEDQRVPAPQLFRVIDADAYAELSTELNALVAAGMDPGTDGLLLAALAYLEHGLFYEADRALARLIASGPADPELRRLRADVLNALGRLDAAKRELEAAEHGTGDAMP